jgi:hypothetical protein
MSSFCKAAALALGTLTVGIAHAAQPPDSVSSDSAANTAMGTSSLASLNGGIDNTAAGYKAQLYLTSGEYNTAVGAFAEYGLTIGNFNTALGMEALVDNSEGVDNTAAGAFSLYSNTGSDNTAIGFETLYSNLSGFKNTSFGSQALYSNTTGHQNSAIGYQALYANTVASNNIAIGANSLRADTSGGSNVGLGVATLQSTTVGENNLAIGANALTRNVSGSSNTAIGANAGLNITGKNNIDIGNEGSAGDTGILRIGTEGTQTKAYVSGIYGTSVSGNTVVVNSSGQLGVVVSSERFKTAINPMAANPDKLERLRPVTFHLKTDPQGSLQYGLIAEEVAEVYPDLVIRDQNGRVDGVRYDELAPILVNELQQERKVMAQQSEDIAELKQQMAKMSAGLARP